MIPAVCWLACLVFFVNTPLVVLAETVIYVSNNCSQPSMPQPCYDFTRGLQALSEPHQSSFTAYIYPGQYSLEAGIVYFDVFNITIEAHDGLADIDCSEGSADEAGLSFINSTMITIRNLSFSGCGIEHNSTTPSTSGDFVPFNATLYFERCVDVTIQSVTVKESLGVGVQFYATTGTVTISDSTIANNPLNPEEGSIGGGLLIEFPLFLPDERSPFGVPPEPVSYSTYDISDCNFTSNQAINAPFKERSGLPFGRHYSAFGYGGGLSVIFRGYSNNNLIQISSCQWLHNEAVYGGGLYVGVLDNSYDNSVILTGFNVFTGNEAIKSGGGAVFAYLFSHETSPILIDPEPNGNRFTVNGAHFTGNRASARGGGMFYLTSRQSLTGTIQNLNQLTISDCVWEGNKGQLGSGLDLSILHSISEGTIHDVVLSNCSFLSNVVAHPNSEKGSVSTLGSGAMYVDAVPMIFDKLVTFCDNHDETALVVLRTKISFNSNTTAVFANNSGNNGGAIALHFSAFMEINAGTHFLFKDNTARSRGGAIYAESFGTGFEQTSLDCMIRYSNMTICPSEWDTEFNFSNNQANLRNNSIYASTIKPCAFLGENTDDSSDINDVFCWNDGIYNSSIWEYDSNTSQSACMKHIQTDIANFSMSTNFSVTPGAQVVLDIKPLNDQDSIISEYIFHVYPSDDEAIKVDEDYNYISNNIVFVYPATKETKHGTIVLEAVQQNIVQFEVNVTFNDCLAGLSLKNDAHNNLKCTCPPSCTEKEPCNGKKQVFSCDSRTASATLLQGYWIGQFKSKTVFGHCISCNHTHNRTKSVHMTLNASIENVTEMLCSDHTKGVLCNECDEGYAPAISYDTFRCVQCNGTFNLTGIGFFITFRILLPLVFLTVIYIIDVPITSGLFHGPILLCQMVSTIVLLDAGGIIAFDSLFPGNGSYEALHKFQAVYTGLYDSFNLYYASSLLEKNCLSKKVQNFTTVIAINYIAAFIPLLVVILFALVHYCSRSFCNCCCKVAFGAHVRINPQRCRIFDNKRNKANFLATAILLSYTNVAVITSYLTTYVALIPTEGDKAYNVLYLDGTIDFLSEKHLPYFVCACLFGVTYLLIVPLFLFFYRPNNPRENGGFLNHLLGQFQNEFRSGRALNPNEDCTYKEPINTNKFKMEIKLQMWHLCRRMCFFYCKCRCSRYLNAFFITRFEHGNYQWFSSVLFLIRLLIVLPFVFSYNAFILLFFQFVISITYAIAVVLFHPYERMLPDGQSAKKIDPNIIEAASMMLLSLLIALSMYQYTYTMTDIPLSKWAFILQAILVWIPLVWIAIVYCVLFYIRHKEKLKNAWVGCCQLIWGRNCVVRDGDANNEEAPLVEGYHRNMELINSGSTGVNESRLAHSTEA